LDKNFGQTKSNYQRVFHIRCPSEILILAVRQYLVRATSCLKVRPDPSGMLARLKSVGG